MTDFNESTCKNPNQYIIDLANDHVDSMNLVVGKVCDVDEQSIIRDNEIIAGVDAVISAVSDLQSAVHATPEQIAALVALIEENEAALTGLATQTAANLSTIEANESLIAENDALILQLNTAQADAATARQALHELLTQLTTRVTASEVTLVNHESRITTLEAAVPVDSNDGITAAQLAAAVEAAKCEVYTNVSDSMTQASAIIKAFVPLSCEHGLSLSAIDTSSIDGTPVVPTPTVPDTDSGSGAPV